MVNRKVIGIVEQAERADQEQEERASRGRAATRPGEHKTGHKGSPLPWTKGPKE